ncbi:MAG: arginine--tRNA ligase [Planctomycetes bacterium]|nr:arginine--tRNA ligase [Planctomycetota bacterium]
MQVFTEPILAALARQTSVPVASLKLERPRDAKQGDLAFPCFVLAKELKKAPPLLAQELAAALAGALPGITAVASGPYINFRIERGLLAREITGQIARDGQRYGGSSEGAGKTIVIDYSSPNIAKPMHIGHIRSTIIGAALVRIFRALEYRVVGINHIGDWGAQFGGLVVALRRWKGEVDLEADPVLGLLDLYQRSKKAVEEDEAFKAEAIAAYQELESGREGEVRELWRWVTEVSLRGFNATYRRLGIQHELVRGESWYEPFLAPALERVKAAGVTEVSRGALIVALGEVDKGLKETPCLLQQTNGTTLYATRDLAALFSRWEEFQFERCLYVVGGEQKLHFRQLKGVLARMGLAWEARVEHVDFGLLLGRGRVKIASRKRGEVLVLDDLIDEVVDEALGTIEAKNPELASKREVADAVGLGALVFNDLKRERIKDVIFDKAEILSFEGDTGPYVQYTHARLASILRKAEASGDAGLSATPDWSALENAGEVLVALGRLPDVVRSAAARAEPSELSQYLLALARDVSTWVSSPDNRVLGSPAGVAAARLALVRAAKLVLGNGLRLLGITAPEEM